MTGHPVRLTLAALAILGLSASTASAGCYGCGSAPPCCAAAPTYEAPVVYRTVVYPRPMYIVDQGPSFNAPVYGHVDRALDEGQYTTRVVRWHHHHHWHHAWRHHGCATGCALGW